MLEKHRLYIYKNRDKFDLNYFEDKSLPYLEIDLSKSYATNKKKIEKIFGNKRKPGIWIIEDSNSNIKKNEYCVVYEVAQTSWIQNEMIKDLQFIYLGIRDSKKNIYARFKQNVYRRYKYQQIYKEIKRKTKKGHTPKIVFRQIVEESDSKKREEIEIKVALSKRAVWWSPNQAQNKFIWSKIKFIEDIN